VSRTGDILAVGFDFGETLARYGDAPLNWTPCYPAALRALADGLGCADAAAAPGAVEAACAVLTRYNTRSNPRTREIASSDIVFEEILRLWGVVDAGDSAVLGRAGRSFFRYFQKDAVAYPDAPPALEALRAAGVPIGLLSDVPYGMDRALLDEDLTAVGLGSGIDVVLTSVDVGWRKPETSGFEMLAKRLGVPADDMVYVGNERKDIEGANAAGMVSVLIDRAGAAPSWGQRYRITSLRELPTLIDLRPSPAQDDGNGRHGGQPIVARAHRRV
jgi:putative hydrolase of the HAD superfamily